MFFRIGAAERILKLHEHTGIHLPTREIVRHGVLMVRHVGDPIVGIDVVDAEEIQAINAQPHVAQAEGRLRTTRPIGQEAHSDVGTLVGRCAERIGFELAVRV